MDHQIPRGHHKTAASGATSPSDRPFSSGAPKSKTGARHALGEVGVTQIEQCSTEYVILTSMPSCKSNYCTKAFRDVSAFRF
jgi:hypothetical protein